MSDNLYSGYKYTRPKTVRQKNLLFLGMVFLVIITMAVFTVDMFFGFLFIKKTDTNAGLHAIEFYAVGYNGFNDKAKAMELAQEVKNNGGAGFLTFDNKWVVLDNSYFSVEDAQRGVSELGVVSTNATVITTKFSAEPIVVTLKKAEHEQIFISIIQSFKDNTITLNQLFLDFKSGALSQRQVSTEALRLYNELSELINQFDEKQQNNICSLYSELMVAANKQLLALFLISTEKDYSNNTASLIKHGICSINFAYLDLLTALQPL